MIEVKNIGKNFDDKWIFRNLNLRVEEGESVVFVGPSGGGKSVLLKLMAGLLEPDEGSIECATQDLGMLFQKNALFDSLTVEENLLFPLAERKRIVGDEAKKLAREMLRSVELHGNEDLYPDEISGGMQKRLGIARALIVEPQLILYDEPTAGLDPVTSRIIAELISRLKVQSQSTLVTVTNDMQRAYQLGDRIFLLAHGHLLGGGSPKEIRATKDPSIRQFIYGIKEGPLTAELTPSVAE